MSNDAKKPLDLDELTETTAGEAEIDLVVTDAAPDRPEDGRDETASRPRRGAASGDELGAVYDIPVQLSAVLGKTTMPVSQLLRLGRGAVVELDRKVGESIDILVNNRLVARGEVVVVDDRLGVTMTEIIKSEG
jgi:flagellar motor switch protein FliN/FliY